LPEPHRRPTLAIIAGSNGSGKSTFFERYLKTQFHQFVNADEIAKTLTDVPESGRGECWIAFIQKARRHGYAILLFFLCTEDSIINAGRVATRVAEGGHPAPSGKILSRYRRSIETAVRAVAFVDELWLYDNSELNRSPVLVARFIDGTVQFVAEERPAWTEPFDFPSGKTQMQLTPRKSRLRQLSPSSAESWI
jgi:predicted ABC-type ATPase